MPRFADGPALAGLALDLGHLLLGHAGVRLVVEGDRHRVAGEFADSAEKRRDRPAVRRADPLRQGGMVDRVVGAMPKPALTVRLTPYLIRRS